MTQAQGPQARAAQYAALDGKHVIIRVLGSSYYGLTGVVIEASAIHGLVVRMDDGRRWGGVASEVEAYEPG